MKSGLVRGSFLCINCLYMRVCEAQGDAEEDVGVPGAGVVGDRGLGPSPLSPALSEDHFDI